MDNTPLTVKVACAKGEILNAIKRIQIEYAMPTCLLEMIITTIAADLRAQDKMELLNESFENQRQYNKKIEELEKELEKAKQAAKAVLETPEEEKEGEEK